MSADTPTGVLLAQLGTPDAPTPKALRRFLGEFLSDRRVIDLNPVLWWLILHGIVLRVRPKKSAALYRRIWTDEGSPILVHSRHQAKGLQARLGDDFVVDLGMRYGEPSIAAALDRLEGRGCARIVVLPLFPQYSRTTTASAYDAVDAWLAKRDLSPTLLRVESFADHPAFLEALAATVHEAGPTIDDTSPLLLSFHGIPQRYADEGDPYPEECAKTASGLARKLGLADGTWRLVYQSRFGREPWLMPYLDATLEALPAEGVERVITMTPSFVADCLETIDEVGREMKHVFEQAGGVGYERIPCPNARPEMIEALAQIVLDRRAAEAETADGG